MSEQQIKRVLVIGNGAAGSQLTAKLAKRTQPPFNLTVLTPFSYSEISVNMTKALSAGTDEHMKCVFPLLKEDNVDYMIDECVELTSTTATLRTGRTIDFDVCVIATGQNIPVFMPDISKPTFNERKTFVDEYCKKIASANCIIIAGGGPVGCELAADIKIRHKKARVVLVHSQSTLIGSMSEPFRDLTAKHLAKLGVEIVLSDRVVKHENNEVTLQSGTVIPCDVFLPAHPIGGNSSFLPSACVDTKGYIKVEDTFKVQLLNNVFAIGDCCDMDAAKTYPKIYDQLGTVHHNVLAALKGTPLKHHVRGHTLMGKFDGPVMIALGHGLTGEEEGLDGAVGYGIGPDCPGFLGTIMWACCILSWPCSYPAGSLAAKAKSDLNESIRPRKGKGFSG